MVQERDRLAKRLADQEEGHKAALKEAQDSENALRAEFETEAAGWAEVKQALSEGFGRIEDLTSSRSACFVSFISCGGASAHPLGVVPEIRADC